MCYVSFSWVFYTISTTMPYRCQAEPGEGRLKHYHPPHHRVCKKPEQLLIPDQGLFPPVILMPAEVRGNTLGKNAVFSGWRSTLTLLCADSCNFPKCRKLNCVIGAAAGSCNLTLELGDAKASSQNSREKRKNKYTSNPRWELGSFAREIGELRNFLPQRLYHGQYLLMDLAPMNASNTICYLQKKLE